MLLEMGIRHRYTRAYRPQTNGKVERFWRTLNEDLIEGTTFDSIEHFKKELSQYLVYYNEHRPHQGINAETPKQKNESSERVENSGIDGKKEGKAKA
jgi:transposase InsO family protein